METLHILHFGTVALTVALTALGVGLGQGLTSLVALEALDTQPHARAEISKTFILGMALLETAAIIGLTMSLMLLKPIDSSLETQDAVYLAECAIAFALCISGAIIGLIACLPAQYACRAVARQPFYGQKIQSLMLLTQSLMQTPIVFGFIIALFIKNQLTSVQSIYDSMRLIGCGLSIGIGSIGPSIGLALFSKEVCKGMGINPQAYSRLLSFTLISEALIESPLIFSLLIALIILQINPGQGLDFIRSSALFSSGLCMGLGTLGVGIASGRVAAKACEQISSKPEHYNLLLRTSLFAQVLIETCSIYALIISFALIFA